ncbi:MAG TPA: dTMP kinase [Bryobacteraceae bacterium]|jgi:dTMP kinase|nr:dTMP kinase [Bryobacteraceae bacterium]
MSTTSGAGDPSQAPRLGLFITFEGPDGSGKSTQARLLAERLRHEGYAVLETVEPGGTHIGQQIRRILLDPANRELRPIPELLLMFAARAQNVEQSVLPALNEGKIVVSDRFTDSSIAYQGAGHSLGWETVLEVDRIACHGLVPDLTLCIDVDTETGLKRAHSRNQPHEMRYEQQGAEFHQRVRAAYHELARREPRRFRLIDGHGSPEGIAAKVWQQVAGVVAERFAKARQA